MLYKDLLAIDVYSLLLVVTRMGVVVMMIPGVAAPYVSTRIRLGLAFAVSVAILPIVGPYLPPIPKNPSALLVLIVSEVTVGVFIGLVMQALMAALHMAANTISFLSGLSNATLFDPISEQQSGLVVALFGNIAVVMIFATDLHHLIFESIIGSYELIVPGRTLLMGDFSEILVKLFDRGFLIGTQLSAPFIVASTVFQAAMGLMARLMPSMNIFFVSTPLQLLLSLGLLMITIPPIMLTFLTLFRDGMIGFVGPR